MKYLLPMSKFNWKKVLWSNIQSQMNLLYGKENLTRLIKEAHVGPGTITRIKEQETSVGIDVLEKVSAALKVDPWQLLHPTLGQSSASESAGSLAQHHAAPTNTRPALAQTLADMSAYLERLDIDDRAEAMKMIAVLADKPERHNKVAASIEGMVAAAFAQSRKRAA